MNAKHIPVLINQVLELLEIKQEGIYIDCTLGVGGHSEGILKTPNFRGKLYAIEADERNLLEAEKRLSDYSNVHLIRDNFENLDLIEGKILEENGHIDGILFDLGLSSLHVDEAERGFSFQHEGPLDMRYDTRQKRTAADIINHYSLKDLLFIFRTYGEEKFAYRIASEIIRRRKTQPFKTTSQLANFIATRIPHGGYRRHKRNPATRIFQALRIATNREIEVLQAGLTGAVKILSPNGRLVVISYHSLEDRIVKHFFKAEAAGNNLKILTKKPLSPTLDEIRNNPRSRSAKLRAAERL